MPLKELSSEFGHKPSLYSKSTAEQNIRNWRACLHNSGMCEVYTASQVRSKTYATDRSVFTIRACAKFILQVNCGAKHTQRKGVSSQLGYVRSSYCKSTAEQNICNWRKCLQNSSIGEVYTASQLRSKTYATEESVFRIRAQAKFILQVNSDATHRVSFLNAPRSNSVSGKPIFPRL
jgi:hypothetical protein